MKISLERGELALPDGFALQIEKNNPFFSDEGTASIPVTLQPSPENMELLGKPDNICNARKPLLERKAFLECGVLGKRCTLMYESVGGESGISASLAFEESEMYADLQDKNLRDIFADKAFVLTKSSPSYYSAWGVYTGKCMESPELYDVAVFPVATDKNEAGEVCILNEPVAGSSGKADHFDVSARKVEVGGKEFSVPAGYGIAPFIYLWALIEHAFVLSGYEMGYNAFKEDWALKRIAVVHNCADACVFMDGEKSAGDFYYSDIVPVMTVGELMVQLHDTFGAFFTCDAGKVSVRLIRDIFSAAPDEDISSYERTGRTLSYPGQKFLERELDTSIESADPAAETLVELRKAHGNLAVSDSEDTLSGKGLFYVPSLGKYYYKETVYSEAVMSGSNCFKYSRGLEMETEEVSSDCVFLPMVRAGGRLMPYIGERIHRRIDVEDRDPDAEQPLQLCYAHFWSGASGISGGKCFCGSSYGYYENGVAAVPDGAPLTYSFPALTPEGLSEYWSEYTSLLADGAPEIKTTLDIPLEKLSIMDFCTVKHMAGCKVLFKSMEYTVTDGSPAVCEAVMQLIPAYLDRTEIPEVEFGNSYAWVAKSTRSVFEGGYIEIIDTDGLQDYTDADKPVLPPEYVGQESKRRKRWLRYHFSIPWRPYDDYESIHQYEEYFRCEASGD